jgi:predicted MFS family arabinose efflux permease
MRGIAFVLLIFFSHDSLIFGYAVVLGISWTATTPLTAAIAADLYGRRRLGVIFGTLFTFMNLGFGVGAFLDAVTYDVSGGYTAALVINAALGLLAAVAVWSVTSTPEQKTFLPVPPSERGLLPQQTSTTTVAD